ncbi:MAG: hypothetical protein ACE5D4_08695 [Thermodesulfobacteriota bacterium]
MKRSVADVEVESIRSTDESHLVNHLALPPHPTPLPKVERG